MMTQEIMDFFGGNCVKGPFCVAGDSSEISGQGQQWPETHSNQHGQRDHG